MEPNIKGDVAPMPEYCRPHLPEGWSVHKGYHHEYGGYVWQPRIQGQGRWIEPHTTERAAWAFLEGVKWALEKWNDT